MARFSEIASALDISEDAVEDWVMEAVTSNLIKAKIDQLEEQVTFLSYAVRSMNTHKWNEIEQQLGNLQKRFHDKFSN